MTPAVRGGRAGDASVKVSPLLPGFQRQTEPAETDTVSVIAHIYRLIPQVALSIQTSQKATETQHLMSSVGSEFTLD